MMLPVLVNGVAPPDLSHALAATDRGLHYGDGVFETALLINGRVRFLDDHLLRLAAGCGQIGIPVPDRATLLAEIDRVTADSRSGVLKIIVTRGTGGRGYRPTTGLRPTRVVSVYPAPPPERSAALRWCETRLARNARLAGIKHLNRLEQVLAQAEWQDERIGEGLMLDTEGELVCGTASNVFAMREGVLVTPDLRFCGVRGVIRAQVLRAARQLGMMVSEEALWPHDLEAASEVFVTNAVRGIRSAVELGDLRWPEGPVAQRLRMALEL